MKQKKLLFVGFGDIATRASQVFLADGCSVTGIARSQRDVPPGVEYWRGAATDGNIIQQIAEQSFDAVVVTLTPDGRRESDYRRAYVDTSRSLVQLWERTPAKPGLVIFVSSTGVYHQNDGGWVDEASPTEPTTPQGQHLLEAEALWQESALNTCIVRFSGIYGPGRTHLWQQIAAGKGGPREDSPYTNRIHVEDCVGVIHHLCHCSWMSKPLKSLYLASDDEPAPSWEVRSWLAERIGYPEAHLQPTPASTRGGNKRCRNARLRATGYQFKHPNYRSGFADLTKLA